MIQLKRAYDASEADDGYRVLVDRLWPRGVSKEELEIDCWMKEVAPTDGLREWFGHDPEKWEEFRERYHEELRQKEEEVRVLREKDREGTLTLVYAARDPDNNNAVALKDHLRSDRGEG